VRAEGNEQGAIASDELHEWLDALEAAARELASETAQLVDAGDYAEVGSVITDLMSYRSAYDDPLPKLLRLPPTLIRKFQKFSGGVKLKEAQMLVDRLRTYLRSMDQHDPEAHEIMYEVAIATPVMAKAAFPAIEWQSVPRTSEVKRQIAQVSQILDEIVARIQRSNNAPEDQYLSEIERQQLIAILQTTLVVLKAPIIEKGLLLKARAALQDAAVKAGEKGVEGFANALAGQGVGWLTDLIHHVFG
jgi:hypothetical protein